MASPPKLTIHFKADTSQLLAGISSLGNLGVSRLIAEPCGVNEFRVVLEATELFAGVMKMEFSK